MQSSAGSQPSGGCMDVSAERPAFLSLPVELERSEATTRAQASQGFVSPASQIGMQSTSNSTLECAPSPTPTGPCLPVLPRSRTHANHSLPPRPAPNQAPQSSPRRIYALTTLCSVGARRVLLFRRCSSPVALATTCISQSLRLGPPATHSLPGGQLEGVGGGGRVDVFARHHMAMDTGAAAPAHIYSSAVTLPTTSAAHFSTPSPCQSTPPGFGGSPSVLAAIGRPAAFGGHASSIGAGGFGGFGAHHS
jgi:hypothetical protein